MDARLPLPTLALPPIPDPTDWDATALPLLHPLDAALRCQVCKDFFTAPVLTNCQHTFCSECIRRALQSDRVCPLCRAPEQEYRLRKNQVVADLVDAFVAARAGVLALAMGGGGVRGEDGGEEGGRRKRRRCVVRAEKEEEEEWEEGKEAEEEGAEEEEVVEIPSPDDGLVPCPLCNKRLKLESVNPHLDICLTTPHTPAPSALRTPAPSTLPTTSSTTTHRPAPIPKITYSLIKEKDLRTKLSALGIPSTGGRKALQERHSEWVTIWNANIDAKRPRSKTELLADLAAWERANARPSNQIVKARWSDERWGEEHRSQYRRLVEEARMRRGPGKVDGEGEGEGNGEGENGGNREGGGGGVNGPVGENGVLTMVTVGRGEVPEVFGNVMGGQDVMGVDPQINGKRKYQEIDSTGSSSSTSNTPAVTEAVQ